ncbi:MAG TPA: hypothetical protein VFQ39_03480, partial [Longimicrobium sp.]|nr:hypothetical protein [Longimicrobium sp.]
HHPALTTIAALNQANERIFLELSLGRPDGPPEYIITRTRFRSPMYDGAVPPLLSALGVGTVEEWKAGGRAGLVVLRATVMDPFLAAPPPAPDHVGGFVAALRRACAKALEAAAMPSAP